MFVVFVCIELGFNLYVIGVVGGYLMCQFVLFDEVCVIVCELLLCGFSYSVGFVQVNECNFVKYGFDEVMMFELCCNLQVGGVILIECFVCLLGIGCVMQVVLCVVLLCYYSGNFMIGFLSGYVSCVVVSVQCNVCEGGVELIFVVIDMLLLECQWCMVVVVMMLFECVCCLLLFVVFVDVLLCYVCLVVMMCCGLLVNQVKWLCVWCFDQ